MPRRDCKPAFIIKPRRQFVDEGNSAKFKTSIDGWPEPSVTWESQGRVLQESGKYKMYETRDFHYLEVKDVNLEDKGAFTCTVANPLGTQAITVELDIFPTRNTTRQAREERSSRGSSQSSSRSTSMSDEPMRSMTISDPAAKDAEETRATRMSETQATASRNPRRTREQFGSRTEEHNATRATRASESNPLEIPPFFSRKLSDQTVFDSESVTLECEVKGSPKPRITWYKGQSELKDLSPDFHTSHDGEVVRLQIAEAYPQDAGDYCCVATNAAGEAVCSTRVFVKAAKPIDIPPHFSRPLHDQTVKLGTKVTFSCEVSGSPEPKVTWFKDCMELQVSRNYKASFDGKTATLELMDISRKDAGEYVCSARNFAGERKISATLTVAEPPPATSLYKRLPTNIQKNGAGISTVLAPPRDTAPTFVRKLQDVSVKPGGRAELVVEVIGSQPMVFCWLHDNKEMKETGQLYQMVHDSNIHKLVLPEVCDDDAGTYICEVYNDYGDTESSCTLDVAGSTWSGSSQSQAFTTQMIIDVNGDAQPESFQEVTLGPFSLTPTETDENRVYRVTLDKRKPQYAHDGSLPRHGDRSSSRDKREEHIQPERSTRTRSKPQYTYTSLQSQYQERNQPHSMHEQNAYDSAQPAYNDRNKAQYTHDSAQPAYNDRNTAQYTHDSAQPAYNDRNKAQYPHDSAQPAYNDRNKAQYTHDSAQPAYNDRNKAQYTHDSAQPAYNDRNKAQYTHDSAQPAYNDRNTAQYTHDSTQPACNERNKAQYTHDSAQPEYNDTTTSQEDAAAQHRYSERSKKRLEYIQQTSLPENNETSSPRYPSDSSSQPHHVNEEHIQPQYRGQSQKEPQYIHAPLEPQSVQQDHVETEPVFNNPGTTHTAHKVMQPSRTDNGSFETTFSLSIDPQQNNSKQDTDTTVQRAERTVSKYGKPVTEPYKLGNAEPKWSQESNKQETCVEVAFKDPNVSRVEATPLQREIETATHSTSVEIPYKSNGSPREKEAPKSPPMEKQVQKVEFPFKKLEMKKFETVTLKADLPPAPQSPKKFSSSFSLTDVKSPTKEEKAHTLGSTRGGAGSKVSERLGKFQNADNSSGSAKKDPPLWKSYGTSTTSIKDRMNKFGGTDTGKRDSKKEAPSWRTSQSRSLVKDKLQSFGDTSAQEPKGNDRGSNTAADRRRGMAQRKAISVDSPSFLESQEAEEKHRAPRTAAGARKSSVENLLSKFDQPQASERRKSFEDRSRKFELPSNKDSVSNPHKITTVHGYSLGDRKKAFESHRDEPKTVKPVEAERKMRSFSMQERKRSFEMLDSADVQTPLVQPAVSKTSISSSRESVRERLRSGSADSASAERLVESHRTVPVEVFQTTFETRKASETENVEEVPRGTKVEMAVDIQSSDNIAPSRTERRERRQRTEVTDTTPVERKERTEVTADTAPVERTRRRERRERTEAAESAPVERTERRERREEAEVTDTAPIERTERRERRERTEVFEEGRTRANKITPEKSPEKEVDAKLIEPNSEFIPPKFIRKMKSANIDEGGSARFSVQVEGEPVPLVAWQKDGKPIMSKRGRFKISQDGSNHTFEVMQAEAMDSGRYTCVASNTMGEEKCFTSLVVKKKDKAEKPDYRSVLKSKSEQREAKEKTPEKRDSPDRPVQERLRSDSSDGQPICFPPKFIRKMKTVNIDEGGSGRFSCQVEGEPVPQVAWQRDGKPITTRRGRFKIGQDGTNHTFEILQAQCADSGRYTCVATNMFGKETCFTNLIVRKKEVEEISDFRSVLKTKAPQSSQPKKPEPEPASDGQPDYRSMLTRKINKTPSVKSETETEPEQLDYRGMLRRKVQTSTAATKAATSITEQSETETEPEQLDYRGMLKRKVQTSTAATKAATAITEQSETETEPEQLDYRGMLRRKVQTSTAATKATPVAEQKDFRGLLSKKVDTAAPAEEPSPPKEAEQLDFRAVLTNKVSETRSTSQSPDEDEMDSRKATEADTPRVVHKLRDTNAKEGGSVTLECMVTGTPPPQIVWYLGKAQIKESEYFHMSYEGSVAKLEIAEVYPEDEGVYICKAENNAGATQTTCSVFVQDDSAKSDEMSLRNSVFSSEHGDPISPRESVASPEVPATQEKEPEVQGGAKLPDLATADQTEPPFVEDLSPDNVHVLRGHSFQLMAKFVGKPYPEIQWFKDKRPLSSGGRLNIETVGETSVLMMMETSAEDTGKYSLTLINELGTDSLSSSVTVEDVPDPPVGQPSASNISPTSLTLSWYGSSYDGGSQVTGYKIEMRKLTTDDWEVLTSTCKHTTYTVRKLEQNAEYLFRVSAGNKHGFSKPSPVSDPIMTVDRTFLHKDTDELPFEPRTVDIKPDRKFNDHYNLGLEIGKGKFGNVFMCVEKSSGKSFAAKFIKTKASQKAEVRQEVEIMNSLHHPKLLLLWDAFETMREIILVMEHISGGELLERIINEDYVLTERECVHFMRQICDGVHFMHKSNILHLDLKPENILCITQNSNEIKIIDFGLARKFDPKKDMRIMFGTPEFVAPEVVNYDEIGFGTDMWSVGVICYILLSGLSPFQGDNEAETFANVTMAQFDFDDETFDDISEDAKDLIKCLLHKNMRKRVQVKQALAHSWLSQDVKYMRAKRLSTDKHKRFLARRKWQKTGHAIRALGRMASLQKAMYSLTGSSSVTRSRTSSTTSNESLGNTTPTSPEKSLSTSLVSENLKSRIAENSVSEQPASETKTDLNQNEEKVSEEEPVQEEAAEEAVEEEAPYFQKKMRDFEVFEGDSARFDVTVAGEPEPDVVWRKDGHPIKESRKYVMGGGEEGIYTLIIKDCGEDDDAQYECRASNSCGDALCRAELYVEAAELDD